MQANDQQIKKQQANDHMLKLARLNRLITQNEVAGVDFTGLSLPMATFQEVVFENILFEQVDFQQCTFLNCRFVNCQFKASFLDTCTWHASELQNVSFVECELVGSALTQSNCQQIQLNCCKVQRCAITQGSVAGFVFENGQWLDSAFMQVALDADLPEVLNFKASKMDNFVLNELNFDNVVIENCEVQRGMFLKCQFNHKQWQELRWQACSFNDSQFNQCEFTDCSWMTNNFIGCKFNQCQLQQCQLQQTVFLKASFSETQFENCVLQESILNETSGDNCTFVDCQSDKSFWQQSQWQNSHWENCNLSFSDWSHATLEKCELQQCNFTAANWHQLTDKDSWWKKINKLMVRKTNKIQAMSEATA